MNFKTIFGLAILTLGLAFSSIAKADTLPETHPTAALVKSYLTAIVEQNWQGAAQMIFPPSLEVRQKKMVEALKASPTMTEEAARLKLLGLKDISELENMSITDAYIADRNAVYSRAPIAPDVLAKKKETLKITILGLLPEDAGKIVHAVVRTSQQTNDVEISELLMISLIQDKDQATKWYINPDMQQPLATPIAK